MPHDIWLLEGYLGLTAGPQPCRSTSGPHLRHPAYLCVQVSAPGSLRYAGEVLARCQALANAAQGGSILMDHTSFKVTAALEGSCLPASGKRRSSC